MKRILNFCFIANIALWACNDTSDTAGRGSSDSLSSTQSSAAGSAKGVNASSNQATNAMSANAGSFEEVMNSMMKDMMNTKLTGDADHDFALLMKIHHQGAIDMANIELSRGTNAELKQVAQNTISSSEKDINDLTDFLNNHQPSENSDFGKKQMDKMMKEMNMNAGQTGDLDMDFAIMMSMHHKEGIQMAEDYLKAGTAEETKKVARNTIKSNSEDLKKLKAQSISDHSQNDMKK